jgi:hypothetical protein
MKIEFENSSYFPHGKFLVRAESREDAQILRTFLVHPPSDGWRFGLLGLSGDGPAQIRSFRFGWTKDPEKEPCSAAKCPLVKPRMLFLDDRSKRIHSALRKYGEKFDLTLVSNVTECLRYLSSEDWDEVRLDHDLHGSDFQNPDSPASGMEVVRYIVKTGWPPNKRKPIFRVHSSNIFAAYLMVKTLQSAGHTAVWEKFEYDEAAA